VVDDIKKAKATADVVIMSIHWGIHHVPAEIAMYQRDVAYAAVDAGVDAGHAELAARTVVYYVLGFTADEQSRLQWDAAGAELPDEQSVLTDDAAERFGFGLALLVDGIAAHRAVVGLSD